MYSPVFVPGQRSYLPVSSGRLSFSIGLRVDGRQIRQVEIFALGTVLDGEFQGGDGFVPSFEPPEDRCH